jgi:large subunit ribosomal protein L10
VSANVEIKKQVVSEITERIQNAKSVVLVKFAGLTVAEDTAIRNEFRKAEVEYKVYKNTLIKKAFENLGVNSFDADLNGPTAVAFGKEETDASKQVVEASKKYADKIQAKSAYIGGSYVDEKGVQNTQQFRQKRNFTQCSLELYATLREVLQWLLKLLQTKWLRLKRN